MRRATARKATDLATLLIVAAVAAAACSRLALAQAARDEALERAYAESARKVRADGISADPSYGYTPDNPLKVGGIGKLVSHPAEIGARKELLRLLIVDPGGRPMDWTRLGSCCPFATPNAVMGVSGLLDIYHVTAKAKGSRPLRIFVNHYDEAPLRAPMGLAAHPSVESFKKFDAAIGHLNKREFKSAADALRPLAGPGYAVAGYYLGIALMAEQRTDDSRRVMEDAARAGFARAQYLHSLTLGNPKLGATDPAAAREWLRTAAGNRDPDARRVLGEALRFRDPPARQDPAEALRWWSLAAEQGNVASQVHLGMAFLEGQGTAKDVATGLTWLAVARNAGDAEGARLFADRSASADQTVRAAAERAAEAWSKQEMPSEWVIDLRAKASKNDPTALLDLGRAKFNGALVERDQEGALVCMHLAARRGNTEARELLERSRTVLPQDMTDRAEKSAKARSARCS